MPEKLTLNDGTELNGSVIDSGELFLYVNESDIQTVFNLLIDPEKTAVIIYTQNNADQETYRGYTKLIAVRDEGRGLITAVLRKEAAANV